MRDLKYLILVILCSFCMLYAEEAPTYESDKVVILPAGTIYEGDYFVTGNSVEISGTVHGDVYALAEHLTIDGVVHGDVLACAGNIEILGTVKRSCRLVGGQIFVSGSIGNNLTAIGANVQLAGSSHIDDGGVFIAGNLDLGGMIQESATVIASNVRISSSIQKNLQAYIGRMRMTSKTVIGGNVDYHSHEVAQIDPLAKIKGDLMYHPFFVQSLVKGTWVQKVLMGSKLIGILMNFFYTFVIGLILIKIFPQNLSAALYVLKTHPFKAFLFGLMLLVLLPLACLLFLMTILGVPFALTLIAFNLITLYTAKIYSIIWGGNWIFHRLGWKSSRGPVLFSGLVIYFLLISIPVFGTLISFSAMVFGLGAGLLSQEKKGFLNIQGPTSSN